MPPRRREPLGHQSVTIVLRDPDSDGDLRETGETLTVDGCSIQPRGAGQAGGESTTAGGDRTTQRFTVYGPPSLARARAWDLFEIAGWTVGRADLERVRVDIDGPPATWSDMFGTPHHAVVSLARVHG